MKILLALLAATAIAYAGFAISSAHAATPHRPHHPHGARPEHAKAVTVTSGARSQAAQADGAVVVLAM